MANTAGLCNTFKNDLLGGIHAFSTSVARAGTTADTFYGALYYATATLSSATAVYSNAGELPTATGYTQAGQSLGTWNTPANSGGTTYITPTATSISWTSFTATAFDTLLIYNSTASLKNAVGVFTFSSQTITSGTFTLNMPTNNSTTGLIRIS